MCEKCLKFVPVCSIKHEIRFPSGGFAPLNPLPGRCPGPAGGLERPPDPSPYLVPILYSSSSYATAYKQLKFTNLEQILLKMFISIKIECVL